MPFIIRLILQRAFLAIIAILGFFGINPDITPLSLEAVQETREKQQDRIDQVLSPQSRTSENPSLQNRDANAKPTAATEVEEKISEIQREFTQSITEPVSQRVQDIIPASAIPSTPAQIIAQETPVQTPFAIKEVIVNIVCLERTRAYTRMTSGSGVIITENGLVLTNAHVVYPFLKSRQFDDDTYSCSVRRGGISNFGYNAELVYYPVDWLRYNSEVIKEATPIGTGENDYAILLITTPVGMGPKTTSYPHVSLNVQASDLIKRTEITVAGYPSSSSGVFEVDSNPGLQIAQSYIEDFFTFSSRSFDVLQTGPNIVARRGSSGGGVLKDDKLYGIVVTTNDDGQGAYLNALTLPYIKRDFENDTGITFEGFLATPLDLLKLRFSVNYKDRLKAIISES